MGKSDADIARIAAACAKQLRKDEKRARDFFLSRMGQHVAFVSIVTFPRHMRPRRVR